MRERGGRRGVGEGVTEREAREEGGGGERGGMEGEGKEREKGKKGHRNKD